VDMEEGPGDVSSTVRDALARGLAWGIECFEMEAAAAVTIARVCECAFTAVESSPGQEYVKMSR